MASPLDLNSVSSHPTWLLSLAALSADVTITHQSFKLECGLHPPLPSFSYQPHVPSAGLCAFIAFYLRPLSHPLALSSALHPYRPSPRFWSSPSRAYLSSGLVILQHPLPCYCWRDVRGIYIFIVNVHHHHLPMLHPRHN